MTGAVANGNGSGFPWRVAGWGGAALLLLLPLVAKAPWTLSDFIFAGVMLGTTGLLLELTVRRSSNLAYRAGVALAIAAAFLLIWINGAIGLLGNEDSPVNLIFAGVLGIALLGSIVARFKPSGMARAMFAAAGAQLLIGAVAIPAGWAVPGHVGLLKVAMGAALLVPLWLASGLLLRKAAG